MIGLILYASLLSFLSGVAVTLYIPWALQRRSDRAEREATPIVVGETWVLDEEDADDPFNRTRDVQILDVKDGFVRYGRVDTRHLYSTETYVVWSESASFARFRRLYRRRAA